MKLDSLERLYVHELKDLYSAEKQILEALDGLIEKAQDAELKNALKSHKAETNTHVQRLETIFGSLDFEPGGHKCKGIAGLIVESKETLKDIADRHVTDAAIISGCQRVEHYEIAAYGVARAFARKLGRSQDVDLLSATIEEEGKADRTLTAIAEERINFVATTT